MSTIQSPGQKRKKYVRIITFLIFVAVTYFGAMIFGKFFNASLSWVKNHQEVTASITELTSEEEEYSGRRGRTKTRQVYYASYEFSLDDETYSNSFEIEKSEFDSIKKDDPVVVWYDKTDPYTNDTKQNVEEDLASNNTADHFITVAPFTAPGCLFLYYILTLIFVRESKKALPEGFYTETSWLDVDDKYIVAIDNGDLVTFDFDKSRTKDVQAAYQQNVTLEELIALSKPAELQRIPIAKIDNIKSHHNSDTLSLESEGKSHSIEFLNQTVKAHALERISPLFSSALQYTKIERTRLQAVMWPMIWLIVLSSIFWFTSVFWLNVFIGFATVFYILPTLFSLLIDPTTTELWETIEAK